MSEPASRATPSKPAKPASRRRTPTAAHRAWLEANRAPIAAHANNRRAQRIHATPAWADLDAIAEFYRRAERLTRET